MEDIKEVFNDEVDRKNELKRIKEQNELMEFNKLRTNISSNKEQQENMRLTINLIITNYDVSKRNQSILKTELQIAYKTGDQLYTFIPINFHVHNRQSYQIHT